MMFIFPFIFKVGNFSEAENNKSLNLHKKATHWSIVGVVVKFYLCYLASGLLNFLLLITDFSSDLFLTSFTSQNRLCRNMREQLFSVLADYSLEEQKDQVYYFKLMIIS